MIKRIRHKLALTCMLITAIILSLMTAVSLLIFEKHYKNERYTLLNNDLDTILLDIQNRRAISVPFLLDQEAEKDLFIFIEENDKLIDPIGSYSGSNLRAQLFTMVKRSAIDVHHFIPSKLNVSSRNSPRLTFEMDLHQNGHYLVAVTSFNSELGHFNFYIVKDLKSSDHYLLMIRLLFMGLTIVGFLLLGLFCFWFSKYAIMPLILARKQQTAFIAAASHELRSPLSVIEMNTTALSHANSTEAPEFIASIHDECQRLKRLVNDLLLLANSDANTWSIILAPAELDVILIDIYELFLPIGRKKNIALKLELPDEIVPSIMADKERIVQILSILLDNAFSYTPEGQTVLIKLDILKTDLMISIIDTGIGISDAHKPYIFDRFYRVDPARHTKEHYGLGLSIAYELVSAHKGQILIEDTPGGGATFKIILPWQ